MISTGQLHDLTQTNLSPHPILSLYLALDQPREARMQSFAQLTDKLKKILGNNGTAPVWEGLLPDVEQARRYLEEHPSGNEKGLALFSCVPAGYFNAYSLPVSVSDQMKIGPYPYIRPLTWLTRDYAPGLTVLLDSRQARMFLENDGEIEELADYTVRAEDPALEGTGDRGRTGDSHLSRRADQAALGFFREVTADLKDLMRERNCRNLVLGGTRGAVDALLEELPPHLAVRVTGTFSLECNASPSQVEQVTAKVRADSRLRRQEALLANLQDNLGRGGQATTGLNEVLASLYEGRVHTLLVTEDFSHDGGICTGCGRLRHVAGQCPICDARMTPVDDVINLAVAAALNSGAAVEEVPAGTPLDQMGNVAALLRYA